MILGLDLMLKPDEQTFEHLNDGWDEETEKFWDLELERRSKEIESGQAIGQPFEQVLREIRAKYSNLPQEGV
jgi:hypothetical protein